MLIFFAQPAIITAVLMAPALLPPLVHLLGRRRRTITVPSIFLMRKISGEKRVLRRWQKILLMLLRSAALAALGASFAGPYLSFGGALKDSPVVFLFDVSLSRDFREAGTTDHETARKTAAEVLERLPRETRAAVISYCDRVEPGILPLTLNRRAAAEAISQTRTGWRGTDHAAGLEAASQMFKEASETGRTVIWFTDAAKTGFSRTVSFPDGKPALLLLAAPQGKRPNAAVSGISPGGGKTITARITSYGYEGPAALYTGKYGESAERTDIILKNGLNDVPTFHRPPPGDDILSVEIRGDALPRDDVFRFRPARDGFAAGKALIVDGNPQPGRFFETNYIKAAAEAAGFKTRTVRFYDFADVAVGDYDCLIFSDFWPAAREDEILSFLASGKKVILFAGDNIGADFSAAGVRAGAMSETRTGADKTEELAGFMPDAAQFGWKSSVSGYRGITTAPEYRALMRTADGTPFVATDGRFTFVNSPADRTRSDFAVKPGFAPLIKGLLSPEKPEGGDTFYGFTGKAAAFNAGDYEWARILDGGEKIPVTGGMLPPVEKPGVYKIEYRQAAKNRRAVYIVNTPPEESDTTRAENPAEFVKNAVARAVGPSDARRIVSMAAGRSAAGLLRLLFLAFLAAENVAVLLITSKK